MAKSANPAGGDGGARQGMRSGLNVSAENSHIADATQDRRARSWRDVLHNTDYPDLPAFLDRTRGAP